jgi:competence protein ComEC
MTHPFSARALGTARDGACAVSPFSKLAAAFSTGVAIGAVAPAPPAPALAALAAASLLLGACAFARRFTAIAAIACALIAGWCRAPFCEPPSGVPPLLEPCVRTVSATVTAPSVRLRDRVQVELAADAITPCSRRPVAPVFRPIAADLTLTMTDTDAPPLSSGARVLVRGTVKRSASAANFGVRGPPSPAEDHLSAVVESASVVARTSPRPVDLDAALTAVRERLSSFWAAHLDPPADGLARALVIGEAKALEPAVRDAFRRTGTAHLVAVSGLHLAILTWLCFGAIRLALLRLTPLARRFDVGRAAAALTVPLLVAFAMLVGGQPPVARSCVMATSVLLARAFGRRAGGAEALALAAAGLLACDPTDIADPGFQLSFAAVTAFALGVRERPSGAPDGAEPPPSAARRIALALARASRRLFFASLAATAATTPIALYHFGQLSAVAIPCNMIAVPFVSALAMPALFGVSFAALAAPGAAALAAPPIEGMLRALDAALRFVASSPYAAIDAPGPLLTVAAVACSVAGLWFASRRTRTSLAAALAGLALCASAYVAEPPAIPAERFTIHVLDVGQGSSALVGFPDGRLWLVDAGGSASGPERFGERLLVPALRGLGVRRLDRLVLSHADPDHVVGAPAAVRAFGPRALWISGFAAEEEREDAGSRYQETLAAARRSGAPILAARAFCGEKEIAGVRVEALHPCHGRSGFDPSLSANDNSVALRFTYGRTSFLLPGDLSRGGEERLLGSGADVSADVLVLGHHGSDSSSTPRFLDAVRPRVAIASAGRDNRYGFPRASVIAALAHRGARLYRTDRDGAIRVVSDGAQIAVTTARGR